DVPDPERVEDAAQRPLAGRLDGGVQVLGGLATEALEALQGLDVEPEDVRGLLHELAFDQLHHDLGSEPVDIHPATPAEVEQAADALCRTIRVWAARDDLALLAKRLGTAHRAVGRHLPDGLATVPRIDDGADHLRDHVASSLKHD